MISFREFLLEKTTLTKHLEKGGDREQVFQRAKKFAQSAWLRNANKKAKKEGGTTKTISDAPEGIKNAQNYSDLLKSISSWKDDDNTIHNNAYSTIVSMGKSLDKTSKGKENAEDSQDAETTQDTEEKQDTENDQDVENTSDNQDGGEKQDSENAETSQDPDAEQLQKEVQKHLDKDYEKERNDKFQEILGNVDAQKIKVADAKAKQTKKNSADTIFQAQKDYQLARKKVLESLSELIKLLFNDVDTSKITDDADKEIEKITQRQALHSKIKELPKAYEKQIKEKENVYEIAIEESKEVTNSEIEKINVDYPDSVKDMKIEHKEKRDAYEKTLKKEKEEKYKDNEKYQQFKELGNKKANELTQEEREQLDELSKKFGIDSEMEEWDAKNKLDEKEIERMTKEWRERQIAQAKASLENHINNLKARRNKELQLLRTQQENILGEIENYKKVLDKGGDEMKVAQRILKMSMETANVNDEESEDKEETIKEQFEKIQIDYRKRLYENKIHKEYKKLLKHFL
jgi:hypothetical protein